MIVPAVQQARRENFTFVLGSYDYVELKLSIYAPKTLPSATLGL